MSEIFIYFKYLFKLSASKQRQVKPLGTGHYNKEKEEIIETLFNQKLIVKSMSDWISLLKVLDSITAQYTINTNFIMLYNDN